MRPGLSVPVRRALALTILLFVLWAAWSFVVSPAAQLSLGREADITLLVEELQHLRSVAAHRPDLERRSRALTARLASLEGYWTGPSDEAIAVSVQNLVRQAVSAGGGQITSTSDIGKSVDHGSPSLTIRFQVSGTLETLQRTLTAIAAATPALFVGSLEVSASGAAVASSQPPVLTIDVDVTAYRQPAPA